MAKQWRPSYVEDRLISVIDKKTRKLKDKNKWK